MSLKAVYCSPFIYLFILSLYSVSSIKKLLHNQGHAPFASSLVASLT